MKRILKELIPPIFFRVLRGNYQNHQPVFQSYQHALEFCGNRGYQDSAIVDVVTAKNLISNANILSSRNLDLHSLRILIGVSALPALTSLRVIDFGGGGGYHYSIVRAVLGDKFDIRWNVVETTAMARSAAMMLSNSSLKFFDNIEDAVADLGHVNLAFSSGALQYTPDPIASLARFLAIKADHVFITRTALNLSDENLSTVQKSLLSRNGPGPLPGGFKDFDVEYPVTFVSKKKFESEIQKTYSIRFSIAEELDAYQVNNQKFDMYGYFCDIEH